VEWKKTELLDGQMQVSFDEMIDIGPEAFSENSRINSAKGIHVYGAGYYVPKEDRFYAQINVEGVMLLPDALTGEEIEYSFKTDSQEVYAFEETDEDWVRVVTDDVISLLPAVVDDILLEVPLQVTMADEESLPEGDGWKIYTEAAYQEMQEEQVDPRLAILKQFKEE